MVTSATIEPPSQRPSTICQVAVGESHVKWKVPARTSAPSTESPITSAAIGITSEKMPSAATFAKAALRASIDRPGQQAEQQCARAGQQDCCPSPWWDA